MSIYQTILKSAENQQLTDKQIWLACSGGRDSMALAFATFTLYKQGKLEFCPKLIHVNHGLQSVNKDWAEFVFDWAKSLDIRCNIVHANLQKGDEQSARNGRYQAMMNIMSDNDVLMLAHHANDQAETLLMRLFNGSGVTGLSGIREWTSKVSIDQENKSIYLWRPWLNITREQITEYVTEQKIPFVDDPTNTQGDNARSWLRTELFPKIKDSYPQVINSVIRSSELLFDADNILSEVYQHDLKSCKDKGISLDPWDSVLNINKILLLSLPRQKQLIHRWLQGNEPQPAGKHRIEEILELIHRDCHDQQTQLNWQAQNYSYSIRRFRNQLHRLRDDWLEFLANDHTTDTIHNRKSLFSNDREDQCYIYHQSSDICWSIQASHNDPIYFSESVIHRKLTKNDKFALNTKQQAQSGKKLMQLLAIPSWERMSIRVIEIEKQIACIISPKKAWTHSILSDRPNPITYVL